jgi:hypothetical protein
MTPRWKIIQHRTITPLVISKRIELVLSLLNKRRLSGDQIIGCLENIFEGTKVQVGEFFNIKRRKIIFIRKGYKGKAHYLISKSTNEHAQEK